MADLDRIVQDFNTVVVADDLVRKKESLHELKAALSDLISSSKQASGGLARASWPLMLRDAR